MTDKITIRQSKDWLGDMVKAYDHPAIALFRALELKTVAETLANYEIQRPILDLGCGEGEVAKALFSAKPDVGLDNWDDMLIPASKNRVYEKLIKGDARQMPFADGAFNTVFSNCVIEHIYGIDKVLSEVARVLRPQGLFIFTTPSHQYRDFLYFYQVFNRLRLPSLAEWYTQKRNKMLNHYNCFSREDWQKKLSSFGFQLIESRYYIGKQTLYEWDKMAFKAAIMKKMRVHYNSEKLHDFLTKLFQDDQARRDKAGAAILVVAQKRKF